jgi:hypothetical protein
VSCAKMTEFLGLKKGFSQDIFLSFLHKTQKNVGFMRNLVCTHIISTYAPILFLDFLSILKYFCLVAG